MQIVHQKMILKKPQKPTKTPLQEENINTRGGEDNLRPNPNPNYSDSYRYWKRFADEIVLFFRLRLITK